MTAPFHFMNTDSIVPTKPLIKRPGGKSRLLQHLLFMLIYLKK